MAYTKTQWNTGDPITQSKMNKIEKGIEDAQSTADSAYSKANDAQSTNTEQAEQISLIQSALDNISNTIGSDYNSNSSITDAIANLTSEMESYGAAGGRAWGELTRVGVVYNSATSEITTNFQDILDKYFTVANARAAYRTPDATDTIMVDGVEREVQTLADRITHIYNKIGKNITDISTNAEDITTLKERASTIETNMGQGAVSIGNRITALDGNPASVAELPSRNIKSIIDELTAAYSSSAFASNGANASYNNLDERFEAEENRIVGIESEINAAHHSTAVSLDARFDSIDGGSQPSRTLPNVISEINDAHRTNLGNDEITGEPIVDTLDKRFDDIDTRIDAIDNTQNTSSLIGRVKTLEDTYVNKNTMVENGLTYTQAGKVLDARQGKVLNDKIEGVKSEVETARVSSIIRTPGANDGDPDTDTTYASLDARLEAIETHAASVREDVDTIASELQMTDITDQVVATTSRIDQLETNVVAMANEIGMLQNGAAVTDMQTAITGTTTRIDTLDADLNTASTGIKARLDAIDNATTGRMKAAEDDIDALETVVGDSTSGLVKSVTDIDAIIDHEASGNDPGGLIQRITSLEETPTSATVVIAKERIVYNDGVPTVYQDAYVENGTNTAITPATDVDYLFETEVGEETKYFYWKYIDNNWELISGGGSGTGNSSAKVFNNRIEYEAAIAESRDEFTDYYVKDSNNNYTHYRFEKTIINDQEVYTQIEIKQDAYTTAQTYAKNEVFNKTEANAAIADAIANIGTDDYTFIYGKQMYYGPGGQKDPTEGLIPVETDNVLSLFYHKSDSTDDPISVSQTIITGGSGGGTSTGYPITFNRITSSPIVITANDSAIIQFEYYCVDDDNLPISGTYSVRLGTSTTIMSNRALVQGTNTVDVTQYCTNTSQRFRIYLNVEEGVDVPAKYWDVEVADIRIETNFNDRYIYPAGEAINFPYTPYGINTEKTIHLKLDGTEVYTYTTTDSGSPKGYIINSLAHGAHLVELYATATINSKYIETPHIFKDIVCVAENNNTPIIGCIYRYDYYGELDITQYNSFSIPYYVYDPTNITPTIILKENGVTKNTLKVNTNPDPWAYKSAIVTTKYTQKEAPIVPADLATLYEKVGNKYVLTTDTAVDNEKTYYIRVTHPNTLTITCGATTVTIKVNVESLGYNITPITDNLVFDFNPTGYSNKDVSTRLWNYNNGIKVTSLTVSNNFDWNNGGYCLDLEGNTYFCIKSGTRAYIDHKLFENDPKTTGAEFKCIFRTVNVGNAQASFLRCKTGQIEPITDPPSGFLKILYEKDENDEYFYTSDTQVDPEKQYYINRDRVALEMKAHEACITTSDQPTYIPYSEDDIIEFEYNIHTIDTEDDAAESYIMTYEDGVGARPILYSNTTKLDQTTASIIEIGSDDCDVHIYRMKVYSTELTDSAVLQNFYADARDAEEMVNRYERNLIYDGDNKLTPESVSAACPDLKVITIEAPYFTNDKANYVKNTTVRCLQSGAGPECNWTWENGFHVGQGTSSNRYGAAGRNIDIIFGFDGVNTPVSKIKANTVQGYVSRVTFSDGTSLTGADAKVALSDTSVPNSWFNIKVNIASSENTNNALLQKRFNDYLPYKNRHPAMKRDSRIKNDMEFYNCVVFIKETDETQDGNGIYTAHREFPRDTEWHFYGIGNIGDSKKTDNTRVNNPWDIKEFCVEVSDNNLPNTMFQTGVYDDGEGGYTFTPPVDDIQRMERMVYPITEAQWTNENNLANKALSLEGYVSGQVWDEDDQEFKDVITNWDSSFEFRYDTGTKDGESFDSTFLKNQQKKSKRKFNEFYHWVITAPTSGDDSFANHLSDWFIEESALYWYLFTERYIMIDSRAKNSFYHWGKFYISQNEYDGTVLADLQEQLANAEPEDVDDLQAAVDAAEFVYNHRSDYTLNNAAAAINDGYRFEMWDYDNDTALGIDNSGILNIAYGKEDRDKRADTGGYYFNAALNIFWQRIRREMNTQLTALYQSAELTTCWSANNLINEFDRWQSQFPEELWRLDIERKYMRPFLQGSWNQTSQIYSTDKTFLRDMANGRKKYQRRQFERDQEIYLATKYLQSAVFADSIELRLGNGDSQSVQVVPIVDAITITPYSDMYIRVMFGNASSVVSQRAKAGIAYTVPAPNPIQARESLQVVIYAASRIEALDDLASFYIRDNNFSRATKLKRLVIGSNVTGYKNTAINSLGIGANHLLKELDIRNCPNLTGSLNLTQCENLINLYANNTAITAVSFATGGQITNAYLPSTVSTLSCNNLYKLTNLQIAGYDQLSTFYCIDSNIIDPLSIVQNTISHLTDLTVLGLNWILNDNDFNLLSQIMSLSESSLGGTIRTNQKVRSHILQDINVKYKGALTIEHLGIIQEFTIIYKNHNGTAVLYTDHRTEEEVMRDPIKYIDDDVEYRLMADDKIPTRPATAEHNYYIGRYNGSTYDRDHYIPYSGWVLEGTTTNLTKVTTESNVTVWAYYPTTAKRQYTVNWYLNTDSQNPIRSGTYDYGTPIDVTLPEHQNEFNKIQENQLTGEYKVFSGWSHPVGKLVEDTNVYAQWQINTVNESTQEADIDFSELTAADLYAIGQASTNTKTRLLQNKFSIGETIPIKLGVDYNFTDGVNAYSLVDTDNPLELTGDTAYIRVYNGSQGRPDIKPFESVIDEETELPKIAHGFTFAIDFKALASESWVSQSAEFVIASCYKEVTSANTINGFKISLIPNNDNYWPIVVTWGDQQQIVDYVIVNTDSSTNSSEYIMSYRKMLVLEYSISEPNRLYVHTIRGTSQPQIIDSGVSLDYLTYNTTYMDTPLILGGNYSYNAQTLRIEQDSNKRWNAQAIIYWCKYWDNDLGENNCSALASWPHETVPFRISGYSAGGNSVINGTNLTLVAAQAFGDRLWNAKGHVTDNNSQIGWSTFPIRSLYNDVIYKAFPINFKSVIQGTSVVSNYADGTKANDSNAYATISTTDYMFAPAQKEITLATQSNANGEQQLSTTKGREAQQRWPWLTVDTINTDNNKYTIYGQYNNTNNLERKSSTTSINPYRYRFNGYYFDASAKIFNMSSDPCSRSQWQVYGTGTYLTVNPGDVWDTGSVAYIYVSKHDIDNGTYVDIIENSNGYEGGWKASIIYDLRTYTEVNNNPVWYYFMKILQNGTLVDGANISQNQYTSLRGLVPEFSI